MGARLAIEHAGRARPAPAIEPPGPVARPSDTAAPLTIETTHRLVPAPPAAPPAIGAPAVHEADFRFRPNGRLLHSGESFLRQGRKGEW